MSVDSIAVMPFIDESGNSNDKYLRDGIAESLITNLGQLSQFSITPRSSSFSSRFKTGDFDAKKIGQELNVQAFVTGHVLQSGNGLKIHIELVDVHTVTARLAKDYPYTMLGIASLSSEISLDIARTLIRNISPADEERVAKIFTKSEQAYQLYLKGISYLNERTPENMGKAIVQFEAATKIDNDYALAYVGLADCYVLLGIYAGTPPLITLRIANSYVNKALDLDPSLAEAHATLGLINVHRWAWSEAEKEFQQAIKLKPNYVMVYNWYNVLLRNQGRFEEALKEIRKAHEIDPVSALINCNIGYLYWAKGETIAAVRQFEKVIAQNPNSSTAHTLLGLAYVEQKRFDEAIKETQNGVTFSGESSWSLGLLGYTLAKAGKHNEAVAIIKKLKDRYRKRESIGQKILALSEGSYFTKIHEEGASGIEIAFVYVGLGDSKQALTWIDADFKTSASGVLPYIRWMPVFNLLHEEPEFLKLLQGMKLPPLNAKG